MNFHDGWNHTIELLFSHRKKTMCTFFGVGKLHTSLSNGGYVRLLVTALLGPKPEGKRRIDT